MTRQTAARRKRIVEDLRAQAVPEPPAGLEEALRRDVPEELELAPEVSGGGEGGRTPSGRRRRYLLAAASVVLAVGAGVLALRVMERVEPPALVQESSGDAAARPSAEADHASRETLDASADRTSAGDSLGPLPEAPPAGHEKQESPVPGAGPEERVTELEVSLSDAVEEVVTVTSEGRRIHESNAAGGETISRRARKGLDGPVQRREAAAAVPPSTGGTAEPNDRPYGDVFFRAYGTHPFLDPAEDPLSTFALDVDTGSWGIVRRYLSDGHLPPPEAVRVEEVVNAFDYGDPPPDEGDFALLAEGSRSPFAGGPHAERYHLVRFGLRTRRVFVEELTGTLQTVARDARVQVELEPGVVERYRLLGYENRDVPDERFRDDTVDAGEVGAGHGVTALYEVKLRPEAAGDATAATLRLRYRSAATGEVEELELPVTAGELLRPWEEAPSSLRLASVAAELAEILRGSYWAKDGDLDELFRRAQAVSAQRPGDVRAAELAALVGRAAELRQAQP